ncbi:hypothetical protein L1887_26483 [Cichorium endivia]|nr:hypothetical protein L1887_26483 [Cichorium endivia]
MNNSKFTSNSITSIETTITRTNSASVSDQTKQFQFVYDLSKKQKAPEELKPPMQVKKSVKQLLNPCAAGNVTHVRQLLFVLRELASPTGDVNYRLAAHTLQALTHHLSSANNHHVKIVVSLVLEDKFPLQQST